MGIIGRPELEFAGGVPEAATPLWKSYGASGTPGYRLGKQGGNSRRSNSNLEAGWEEDKLNIFISLIKTILSSKILYVTCPPTHVTYRILSICVGFNLLRRSLSPLQEIV
ncbi:hypothetical protein SUGI_0336270 [Cryptomeria japonica]|nr:hypothetical protein SUGI_0336270 [Cryptomeria japonica]